MTEIILITGIIFLSSLVRSIFGFADALIAMPLLLLVTDISIASPLVALFSTAIALGIIIKDKNNFKAIFNYKLLAVIILTIPIGAFLVQQINQSIIYISLGATLIFFSLFKLYFDNVIEFRINNFLAYSLSIISGLLGGAYNVNGPPIVIHGTLSKWEPQEFRAKLQGFFLPTNIIIIITHITSGLWTVKLFSTFSICIPFAACAFVLGTYINKKLNLSSFNKAIYYLLLLLGISLILNTL